MSLEGMFSPESRFMKHMEQFTGAAEGGKGPVVYHRDTIEAAAQEAEQCADHDQREPVVG